jgi:hypothetical protein
MIRFLQTALPVAGMLHFALLIASFRVPRVLRWEDDLRKVDPLTRQLVLVHGAFIVLTIIAFGTITLATRSSLLVGSELGAAVALFIALFWFCRLLIQLFYFDAEAHLTSLGLRLGYRALTMLFVFFTTVYFLTAWVNVRALIH